MKPTEVDTSLRKPSSSLKAISKPTSSTLPIDNVSSSSSSDNPRDPSSLPKNSGQLKVPAFNNSLDSSDHYSRFEEGSHRRNVVPTTPEEEMVFDRGLLFTSRHRPSTRSDSINVISSAPIPSLAPLSQDASEPGLSTVVNMAEKNISEAPAAVVAERGSGGDPREFRSAPIFMSNTHHSSAIHPISASLASSHLSPSRSSPPNASATTQASAMSSQQQQQYLPPLGPNNPLSQHQLTPRYSTPGTLRPDSVCFYPDSSPVMAPNVLAAVDARLRASSSQQSLTQRSSAPSLRQPRSQQQLESSQQQLESATTSHNNGSGRGSRASSVAPVLTHLSVLQSSEGITSREQLYDVLNGDDEDEINTTTDTKHLEKPKPVFIQPGRRSLKSSRRNSNTSSFASSSSALDIELNAKGERLLAASSPRPMQVKAHDGSIRSSKKMELVSAAMVTKEHNKESYNSAETEFSNPSSSILFEKSEWLKRKNRASRKWRGICCVVGLLAFIAVIAGIVLGFITRKGKVDGLAPPLDPDRPTNTMPPITQFTPNPNLRKSFYGLDYNPAKSLMPWCGVTLQNVVDDIIIMSQLTNRIRLYGMDCQQADLTFQAINALNLNKTMKVVLTLWVDNNTGTVERQYNTLFKVLDTYGTDMVQGISVGNEVLFRKDMDLTALSNLMTDVRNTVKSRYGKSIPIFTSEIGNNLNSELAAVSDELSGNLHPYFAGTAVSEAANWTIQQYNDVILGNPTKTGLKGAISEVGWPSAPASAIYQTYAVPGVANLQTMIDTFICEANQQGIPYYWFEYKDEPWKNDPKVPVEPYWGLFDKDGNLKIKIPDCIAP